MRTGSSRRTAMATTGASGSGSNASGSGKTLHGSAPSSSSSATESHTILFEWPLTGLKQIFDSSKSDVKSKVVKSQPFGDGRWTVLFYAQSGNENVRGQKWGGQELPIEHNAE